MDNDNQPIGTKVNSETKAKLIRKAGELGISLAQLLKQLLEEYLEKYGPGQAQANLEAKLTGVETKLTSLETRLTNLETKLTKVETRLNDASTVVRTGFGQLGAEVFCPHCNEFSSMVYNEELNQWVCENCGKVHF